MARQRSEATRRLIAQVAWLYYQTGLTQQQIADRLEISRVRVTKLIGAAHNEGIVRITVSSPYVEAFELERQLCSTFSLTEAVVAPSLESPDELRRVLGTAGAACLERVLAPGDVLGTAWGLTVFEVARQLHPKRPLPDLLVVQLMGGLTNAAGTENPLDVTQVIAEKYQARHLGLFAPAVVDSKSIRETILSDRGIERMFEVAGRATKALVGIGPASEKATLVRSGFAAPEVLRDLMARGAVGDIVGRYFDVHGRPIESDLNDRTMSLDLPSVKEIPCVVGVAGGPHKIQAILGALRGGYLNILITDEKTASSLTRLAGVTPD